MELLRRGAEAELWKADLRGEKALLKKRVFKSYRNKELDEKIRERRTTIEANLLRKARETGVNTPKIFQTNKEKKEIWMELIEGKRVKDVLKKENVKEICLEIGKGIGKMHSAGLVHGDLTTSNILLKGKELYFIDFGLGLHSKKIEDKAVDLLVFKKTFEATHCELMQGWDFIQKGYLKEFAQGKEVIERITAIENRARYH